MAGMRISLWVYEEDYKEAMKLLRKKNISFSSFIRSQLSQFVAYEGKGYLHIPNKSESRVIESVDGLLLDKPIYPEVEIDLKKTETLEALPQEVNNKEEGEKTDHQPNDSYLRVFTEDDLY